jgi:hypothetical protein
MRAHNSMLAAMALAMIMIAALPLVATAGERRSAPMHELTDTGPGAVIPGTSITVNATSKRASIKVKTRELTGGNAYTIWVFSFSNPSACVEGCGFDEAEDPADPALFNVDRVAGHIVGNGNKGNFGGSIKVPNADGAEYHVVVADHGPKDAAQLPDQIKTPHPNQIQIGIILP